ncbi:hypothetical protein Leryth_001638 [Lithospermum erythrorhizon]|nr:hypothetical protein Leryth_001638 [Lithospermum erythrorhizon]
MGALLGRGVKGLVLEACLVLEDWGSLERLIVNGVVEHSSSSSLMSNLIEKRRSDLVVLCLKNLSDISVYELMCVLKYFLAMPKDGIRSMGDVRKEWESQALLAIEKVSDKGSKAKNESLARDASLWIMMAYDGFSVSELCLHHFLASKNLDDVILAACISKLDGSEIMSVIKYLAKWLQKYERFPQAGPCPNAASVLGLRVCDWIPTQEAIIKCLGLVVDEHFSSLVLHQEFHEELESLGSVVTTLAAEANLCASIANLTNTLRSTRAGIVGSWFYVVMDSSLYIICFKLKFFIGSGRLFSSKL